MTIANEWNINNQDPSKILKISTSTTDTASVSPEWNELFCFAQIPSDSERYIHIALELGRYETNTGIIDNLYPFTYIIIDGLQYESRMDYTLNLKSYNNTQTILDVSYYQRCDFNIYFSKDEQTGTSTSSSTTSSPGSMSDDEIQDDAIYQWSVALSLYNQVFLYCLCSIGFVVIIVVSLLSMIYYPSGDPINYFAVIWMILELWDFWSDISFTIFYL